MTFAEKLSLAVLGYCVAFAISNLVWANALTRTGLSPFGPSQQAVSSASPLQSTIAGER